MGVVWEQLGLSICYRVDGRLRLGYQGGGVGESNGGQVIAHDPALHQDE